MAGITSWPLFVVLAACGNGQDASTSGVAPASSASTATSSPAGCPVDEDLSAATPFGIVGEGCDVVPYVNSANAVECASVWRVGERLPDDYVGCDTSSWPWCEDPGLEGSWKYQDMYAEPGGLIVRGDRRGRDNSPC